MTRLRTLLETPRTGAVASWILLAFLMHIAFLVRFTIQIDGALDTDTINFGLAAFRFSVLDHQPHPPGYPGYVLMLRAVHLLLPSLGPLDVALWTCRLTGVLTIPAAYWACRQALGRPSRADLRPFAAAALAVVHPILWYYGGDGQSHDVEALAMLLLFGLALRGGSRLVLVAVCGLAGSLRPTIALLGAPLLVWRYWRRPPRDWLLALVVGTAAVAVWALPTIWLTGGWDLYHRAEKALVTDLFIANYSVFGARARVGFVTVNLTGATYCFVLALLPLIALDRQKGAWLLPWWLTFIVSYLFYALVYTAEAGYFSGVAALACLVPATWREGHAPRIRAWLAVLASVAFMLLGPAGMPLLYWDGAFIMPTLAHVADIEQGQKAYRRAACASPDGRPLFIVTDNPVTTHTRLMPLVCRGVTLGLYMYDNPLNPSLDNWLIFYADGMDTLPTDVPLEVAPHGGRIALRAPVAWVERAPDASPALDKALAQIATCPSLPVKGDGPRFWPARCIRIIAFGQNVIDVPSR